MDSWRGSKTSSAKHRQMEYNNKNYVDAYPSISSPNQYGYAIMPLLNEATIHAHLHWSNAFHSVWRNKHYTWLTTVDETNRHVLFCTHHMTPNIIIIVQELQDLFNWRENPMFLKYLPAKVKVVKKLDGDCLERLDQKIQNITRFFQKVVPRMVGTTTIDSNDWRQTHNCANFCTIGSKSRYVPAN